MIFVTVGTHLPFDRLVRALDACDLEEELVVQLGDGGARPKRATCVGFMPFDELVERILEARIVVCHAGVGSILCCLRNGKRPVVVPRKASHGEAVDDHQLEFSRRLHAAGLVTLVEDVADLPEALRAPQHAVPEPPAGGRLASELGAYVRKLIDEAA